VSEEGLSKAWVSEEGLSKAWMSEEGLSKAWMSEEGLSKARPAQSARPAQGKGTDIVHCSGLWQVLTHLPPAQG
jgi:hypothetical protein